MNTITKLERAYLAGEGREGLSALHAAAIARWGMKIHALTGNGYLLLGKENGRVYYALQGDTYPHRAALRSAGGKFIRRAYPLGGQWRMTSDALDKLFA